MFGCGFEGGFKKGVQLKVVCYIRMTCRLRPLGHSISSLEVRRCCVGGPWYWSSSILEYSIVEPIKEEPDRKSCHIEMSFDSCAKKEAHFGSEMSRPSLVIPVHHDHSFRHDLHRNVELDESSIQPILSLIQMRQRQVGQCESGDSISIDEWLHAEGGLLDD